MKFRGMVDQQEGNNTATMQELEDSAEQVFNTLNNHPRMLKGAVFFIKKRAMLCMQNGGRVFDGRKWRS